MVVLVCPFVRESTSVTPASSRTFFPVSPITRPLPFAAHSSRRLYFLNAPRFHFIDLCLSGLASAIPLALVGVTPQVVVLVAVFTALHGNWQHANVRYKLGWLNWIFAGAELHRWHHSSIIRHSNSNYGNNLILFDILFGYIKSEKL